jgi:hypothetical protein
MQMAFSTVYANDPPGYGHGLGRLNSIQAWSAASPTLGDFVELQIGEKVSVSGIITQGRANAPQWVTSYKIQVTFQERKQPTGSQKPLNLFSGCS